MAISKYVSVVSIAASICLLTGISVAADPQPSPPSHVCIDDSTACETPPSATGVKWHPGQYMLLEMGSSQERHFAQIDSVANESAIAGISVQIWWAEMEAGQGNYTWSKVDAYLAKAQSARKRLIVRINDRRFSTSSPSNIVPDYVRNMGGVDQGLAQTKNGYIARIWRPDVMSRLIALYQAFGARYNSNPYLEGVATEESTPGFNSMTPPGDYTSTALHLQWQRLIVAARGAMPNTQLFFLANFLKPDESFIETMGVCALAKCSFSGPDILPDESVDGYDIARGALGAHDYRGEVPIAPHMEAAGLGGKQGNYTPQQVFDYAKNTLHANYLIWRRNTWFGTSTQQWDGGILPLIRANPVIYTNACPRSITCNTN